MSKGNAVPIRFDDADFEQLDELTRRTGLKNPEIIRRALRLLHQEVEKKGVGFIFESLADKAEKMVVTKKKQAARKKHAA